jgi:hypothetical protein
VPYASGDEFSRGVEDVSVIQAQKQYWDEAIGDFVQLPTVVTKEFWWEAAAYAALALYLAKFGDSVHEDYRPTELELDVARVQLEWLRRRLAHPLPPAEEDVVCSSPTECHGELRREGATLVRSIVVGACPSGGGFQ